MPEEEHQYVRRELTLASWKHLSDFPDKISHRLPKAKCEVQLVTMEDGTLQRGKDKPVVSVDFLSDNLYCKMLCRCPFIPYGGCDACFENVLQ